ncbi:hypothetical protein Echvi_4085 [Echinicola vietnamensis DSM 17526]|uniref:Uncharacterized protein n=1 Tax=Echinicola vietnamensis (strain DSM 17526 / LMG 23754 / KMM 6221) TaxID=926556 RepID=L0G428_ECHVK|nr:hypothetical protein Echvi_4085 [Echinicola vietnamensis DSM 17526]
MVPTALPNRLAAISHKSKVLWGANNCNHSTNIAKIIPKTK